MANIVPFVGVYLVLVGLMLGSFINMAADRVPRGESLIAPGSHCRACGRRLNAIDLLPVAGYMLRGGRCATCRTPIGASAPIVEALCGGLAAMPAIGFGAWPGAAVGLGLVVAYGLVVVSLAVRRGRRRDTPG